MDNMLAGSLITEQNIKVSYTQVKDFKVEFMIS